VLQLRLIFGTLMALAVVALLLLDGWLARLTPPDWYVPALGTNPGRWLCNGAVCAAVVLAFTLAATRELLRFAAATGHSDPLPIVAYVFGAGLVIGPYVTFNLAPTARWHDESWGMVWLAVAVALAFFLQTARRRFEQAMVNLAATLFITFYGGGLAGYMTKLRMEVGGQQGVLLLLFSIFVVKMTDVGAFAIGSLFGRHKLIEWLSPKKTWEGLIGGAAVALLCALGVGHWLHRSGVATLREDAFGHLAWLLVFGALMAVNAVAGDLFASLLKRDAAFKDSGRSIPGMGGILDVLDSPLLAAPAAWFFWTRLAPLEPMPG
jgi:phosphatidate cytidylyltransferase